VLQSKHGGVEQHLLVSDALVAIVDASLPITFTSSESLSAPVAPLGPSAAAVAEFTIVEAACHGCRNNITNIATNINPPNTVVTVDFRLRTILVFFTPPLSVSEARQRHHCILQSHLVAQFFSRFFSP
jgi:copper chaperone CopZ